MEAKEKPRPAAILTEQCHFPRSLFHHFDENFWNLEDELSISQLPDDIGKSINDQNQWAWLCDDGIACLYCDRIHIDGVMALSPLIFSSAFCSITKSLISRQPEIRLQYQLKFWQALCIGWRHLPELHDLWVAGKKRILQCMRPAKQIPNEWNGHIASSTSLFTSISIATSIVLPTRSPILVYLHA